ncbi:MAG: AraC family transcriptional regulator [gamma proteobacterium symbiont of Lucinoma myriamae]|nr:AraC family transcriptional regulator [gamma proteobacterium symbiont of Lucinoma myriamae]
MQFSYSPPTLKVLWNLLKENHINPESIFSKYNLNYSDLKNTELRVAPKIIPHLWNDAYNLIELPCFGLNAYKYWHPSYLGILGYAWLSSKSLREGFTRLS